MAFRGFETFFNVALIASTALNLYQMREINALRRAETLQVGTRIAPIAASDREGRSSRIELAGSRQTLLYVFSPHCGWCTRNQPNIKALTEKVKERYRVIFLSLTDRGLQEYLHTNPLVFEIYSKPSAEAVAAYKMEITPQTIVLSRDGRVERVWQGAYVGRQKEEIERYFDVRLPGLTAAPGGF
jgi:peroxiredoxin